MNEPLSLNYHKKYKRITNIPDFLHRRNINKTILGGTRLCGRGAAPQRHCPLQHVITLAKMTRYHLSSPSKTNKETPFSTQPALNDVCRIQRDFRVPRKHKNYF